ncbi:hypothetical protein MHM95_16405 [Pseudoalteromonas sp. CnMc7-15]|uniref:hypothetical protein n=1 Tax=unclassified Pseudoalteromonas TaxID=194690 RepID=UPI001EF73BD0|nr:hypothetical protein [Pseudoalteromonas sp. CnMc7-15]MCG7567855.1 hypothetical protein [Pseudoalteromonas sp. CnMc7-15]
MKMLTLLKRTPAAMLKNNIFLTALFFSSCAISQPTLTLEENRVAEIYANYVSRKLYVELCSEHNPAENYHSRFEQWTNKNYADIDSGRLILTRYYSSRDSDIDYVFKWKTDAEGAYFREADEQEKLLVCKRLINFLKESI